MIKRIRNIFKDKIFNRMLILSMIFIVLGFVLIRRLFDLQIMNGENYQNNFTLQIKRETTIPSTRGCIYDSAGNLLAYNKLAYDVTFQDVASYESTRIRNLTINGYLYKIMQILYANGDDVYIDDFDIRIDDAGGYEYTSSGFELLRFKADVYGRIYTAAPEDTEVDEDQVLSAKEAAVTAEELINELGDEDHYGVLGEYTPQELEEHGLPESLSKEDALKLIALRAAINQNSYQKYLSTTIAKDISDQAMSSLMESKGYYVGVDVVESSIRVYNESPYYSNIIGYTGPISSEEIESLNTELGREVYDRTDIVGKAGLEQYFEAELQGTDGKKSVYVNNLGQVLKEDSEVEPQAGNNLYLTINTDYQEAAYHLIEQYVAGIINNNLSDIKEFDNESVSSDYISIPVYEIYYNFFENNILSVSHMEGSDATALEQEVYGMLQDREAKIFAELKSELLSDNPKDYKDLDTAMQVYVSYLTETTLPELGIMKTDAIDETDSTYVAWETNEEISLKEYLTYAIAQDWMDVSGIMEDSEFWDSNEIFSNLCDYLEEYIRTDRNFSRKVYRYMIEDDTLSPSTVCRLLYDQGILEMDEYYDALKEGSTSAFSFITSKIYSLELKPSQLGVQPCSGSLVVVDPNTGNTLACVTYPGYDNNRLVNEMDDEYFEQLVTDKSSPFYNKATQELTAPGSTYKMVTATAGVMEGVVSVDEQINCTGTFELSDPAINCWIYPGMHGGESLITAIRDSCNFYFNTVGFRLGDVGNEDGTLDDAVGIEKMAKYAAMYGLDSESGIEMDESTPHVADFAMAPSAMGQSNHAYATVQLARYAATLANGGTCYDLTLLDKITDSEGRTVLDKEPVIHSYVEADDYCKNAIKTGMQQMVQNNTYLKDIGIDMAGKTGTAEQTGVPSHALFVGYAPLNDPQVALACRITNGYNSAYSSLLAKDMLRYIFNLADKDTLITGQASDVAGGLSSARTD